MQKTLSKEFELDDNINRASGTIPPPESKEPSAVSDYSPVKPQLVDSGNASASKSSPPEHQAKQESKEEVDDDVRPLKSKAVGLLSSIGRRVKGFLSHSSK